MVCDAPGASEPKVHGNGDAHAPLLETKLRPLGVGSFTTTLVAVDGRVFATGCVEAAVSPGTAVVGRDLVPASSACGVSWSVSVAVPGLGSAKPGGGIASTVLVRVPVASGGTVPLSRNVAAAFAG